MRKLKIIEPYDAEKYGPRIGHYIWYFDLTPQGPWKVIKVKYNVVTIREIIWIDHVTDWFKNIPREIDRLAYIYGRVIKYHWLLLIRKFK